MNGHLFWLWMWFFVGAGLYMLKRAFYLITGPNPVANSVGQFVKVAGVPLLFRFAVDSAIYWSLFMPQIAQAALQYFGDDTAANIIAILTKYGAAALIFGMAVDPLVDWAIGAFFSKLPILKDFWPQMPPPLKSIPVPNS